MIRMMAAWSIMLSVRRCMGLKAGLLEAVGGKLGPCVALYCCWTTVAAEGDQKRRFFSYSLENGFLHGFFFASVYISFLELKPFLAGVKAEVFFASALTFLALDTSAEWSDPLKGFQHRGMIPVLGPRGVTPHAHAYRRSRVRSPVRPTLIFLSLESTLPQRPPYATSEPRGARIINLTGSRSRRGCSGYARPPALVCGRKRARGTA